MLKKLLKSLKNCSEIYFKLEYFFKIFSFFKISLNLKFLYNFFEIYLKLLNNFFIIILKIFHIFKFFFFFLELKSPLFSEIKSKFSCITPIFVEFSSNFFFLNNFHTIFLKLFSSSKRFVQFTQI